MKSETYEYQKNYRTKYIIQILIFLLIILFAVLSVLYLVVNKNTENNYLKILIFIIIFGCYYLHPFRKRYPDILFEENNVSTQKKNNSINIRIDKTQEIWVLLANEFRYIEYIPQMTVAEDSLIVIGNHIFFEDQKIVKRTNWYNGYLRHLHEPFGRGYISIIYREPLKEWLNLYSKQIYRDRFPVENYNRLQRKIEPSFVAMHHF